MSPTPSLPLFTAIFHELHEGNSGQGPGFGDEFRRGSFSHLLHTKGIKFGDIFLVLVVQSKFLKGLIGNL